MYIITFTFSDKAQAHRIEKTFQGVDDEIDLTYIFEETVTAFTFEHVPFNVAQASFDEIHGYAAWISFTQEEQNSINEWNEKFPISTAMWHMLQQRGIIEYRN